MGGASLTHDTTTLVGANAHAARPLGEWARIAARARGAARGLPARQRSGRRSRRRARAAARGRRGRGDRSALALGRPGFHSVRAHRGDAGRGQPPRRARRSPAGRRRPCSAVADPARGAGPPARRSADAEGRRQGERRALRARAVVHRALRQRHRVRARQRRSRARARDERRRRASRSIDTGGGSASTSRTTVFGASRRRSDPVAVLVLGPGARRQPRARARIAGSSRRCAWRSGAGAGWSGRPHPGRARRSDNAATYDNQIPFHPR